MIRIRWVLVAILSLSATLAHAMEGVFDRSAEVKTFQEALGKAPDREAAIQIAKDITTSGISDPALATAVNDRLMSDYKVLSKTSRDDAQYGMWMVKALVSFGIEGYADNIKQIAHDTPIAKLRDECAEQVSTIEWHKKKNEIMSSRRDFSAGDNPKAVMLLNLLKSGDYTYGRYAAWRMNWEKILDPRLLDEMTSQVNAYVDTNGHDATADDAIKHYMKVLGYSTDAKHRAVIERVAASNLDPAVRKYAKRVIQKHG